MHFTDRNTLGDVYRHPAGRDIIDKILAQTGAPARLVSNPLVHNLKIKSLERLSFGKIDRQFIETLVDLLNAWPQEVSPTSEPPTRSWWKDEVVYQIYPRSFQDSNGDGIGDLQGIISRLDYLKDLGVGALWMSPIFDSPNDDMGYDIRDYRKIMTEFGTMDDFDELVEQAHARELKVILDLVVNHTSDEHEWFQEALADPSSPYRDYYLLRNGNGSDEPPNNWESFFSGPAWNHYPTQDLWALHLFSSKQMDLNWDNHAVRDEVAKIAQFWVDRGVDGFRLDVINYISKREGLPDGNKLIGEVIGFRGIEHYFYGPHLHSYLLELQKRVFAPNNTFTVGETPGIGLQVGKQITAPHGPDLDLVFSFDHLETPGHTRLDDYRYDLNFLKQYYQAALREYSGQYWMSLFFENHDNPRMISKVNPDPRHREALGKLLGGILLTLRGTPFLFQGQELGMINQNFASIKDLRDVEALNQFAEWTQNMSEDDAFGRLLAGTRDHARTPVQWDATKHGGFGPATPWIEGDDDYLRVNVAVESEDPNSVLNFYRALLHWRHANTDFIYSDVEFLDSEVENYWVYTRGEYLVQMNLGSTPLNLRGGVSSLSLARDAELVQSNLRQEVGPLPIGSFRPYEWRLSRLVSSSRT